MKYIIYGASNMGQTAAQIMDILNLKIECFVDGDINKHGKCFVNRPIISPQETHDIKGEYIIVIASMFYDDILKNLLKLKIKKESIICLADFVTQNIKDIDMSFEISNNNESTIIFDCLLGLGLGGLQNWTFFVAKEFLNRNKNVGIITVDETAGYGDAPVEIHDYIKKVENKSIHEIVNYLAAKLPCVVFTRHVEPVYIAAQIVKNKYPDKIKIISEIHTGYEYLYKTSAVIKDTVDGIFCVSNDIIDIMVNKYKCDSKKVFYKESPIVFDNTLKKLYSYANEPIQIGYAARIEVYPKRADLLPILLDELENLRVNYVFNIAGNGSYLDTLANEIELRGLKSKVNLLGLVPHENMNGFYEEMDIFVNVSDYEGVCLSMLEAMACGVVPIETEVCGAREFISDGINGYVCSIGDMKEVANAIKLLDDNRKKIKIFGEKCREIIKRKCNKEDYINYLLDMINI